MLTSGSSLLELILFDGEFTHLEFLDLAQGCHGEFFTNLMYRGRELSGILPLQY
jgi:hypothetical protein